MAKGVNKVILIGNLGKDPELTYTPGGMAICKFSLATTESRKDSDGTWQDETEWHRIVIFGKQAETAGQLLVKGMQVYIEGKIKYGSYEKDGIKRYTTDIMVWKWQLLGSRLEGGGSTPPPRKAQPQQSEPVYDPTVDEDTAPF